MTRYGRARRSRDRAANRAVGLKVVLPEVGDRLTPRERALLSEWLDRLVGPAQS